MKKQLPAYLVLLVITLIAGIILGATYQITKDPIDQQAALAAENARKAALPQAETFEPLTLEENSGLDWLYVGKTGDQVVGYVGQATVQGFGGEVEVIAGLDENLTLTGVSVGGSNFSETAGLGAKAKDAAFTDQFAGKTPPLRVIKAGDTAGDNTIDAITAATITSGAVNSGVTRIANYVKTITAPAPESAPVTGNVFGASAKGYKGPVWVDVTFDADGKITSLSVGNEKFQETEGVGTQVKEPFFTEQFIGMQAPVVMEDVDAVSGATVSSTAVVNAINKAYEKSKETAAPAPEAAPVPADTPVTGNVFGASAKGYKGPVWVDVTFDADDKITSLSVGNEKFKETEGVGTQVKEPFFVDQFIGKQAPVAMEDIDAVSGATVSSTAVVNAINKAYEKKQEAGAPAAEETVAQPAADAQPVTGNVFGASAKGYKGPVWVDVTFDADGKITSLSVGNEKFKETEGVGTQVKEPFFVDQFIGMQAPVKMEDVDAVSGATVSSTAVVNAINKAYEKSLGQE